MKYSDYSNLIPAMIEALKHYASLPDRKEVAQYILSKFPSELVEDELPQCDICGDHHEPGDIPRECETGDGI